MQEIAVDIPDHIDILVEGTFEVDQAEVEERQERVALVGRKSVPGIAAVVDIAGHTQQARLREH